MTKIVTARRWIRDDTDMQARLGDPEEFLELDGVYYPLSYLRGIIPIQPDRLYLIDRPKMSAAENT